MSKLDKLIWRARHKKVEKQEKDTLYAETKKLNQVLDAEGKMISWQAKRARELAQEDDGFRGIDIVTSMAGRGLQGSFWALAGSIEGYLDNNKEIFGKIKEKEYDSTMDGSIWDKKDVNEV